MRLILKPKKEGKKSVKRVRKDILITGLGTEEYQLYFSTPVFHIMVENTEMTMRMCNYVYIIIVV